MLASGDFTVQLVAVVNVGESFHDSHLRFARQISVSKEGFEMSIDITEFEKNYVYERTATIPEVTADLQTIAQFDAHHEQLKKKWGFAIAGSVLFGIASFFGLAISKQLDRNTVLAVIWLGLCFCGFVFCIMQYRKHSRSDLANRRYELLEEVLRLLLRDSSEKETVAVRLDLQRPDHTTKRTGEGKVGPWSVKYYADPWLDLSGRLLDGTSFRLEGLEKYQARRKTYRSTSGKTKSKSKSKNALQVTLSLKPSAKQYVTPDAIAAKLESTVQLPGWSARKSVGLHKDRLQLTAQTTAEWHGKPLPPQPDDTTYASGPHLVAMMFLSLYQALNESRTKRN